MRAGKRPSRPGLDARHLLPGRGRVGGGTGGRHTAMDHFPPAIGTTADFNKLKNELAVESGAGEVRKNTSQTQRSGWFELGLSSSILAR